VTARTPGFAALCRALSLACIAVLAACDEASGPTPLSRGGRLGAMRDLVLFERSEQEGGPFFLDRFESTRQDFAEFVASPEGAASGASALPSRDDLGALPASGMDMRVARAFARWRRCRLMRADEWAYACTSAGRDAFPWGSRRDPSRANTSDLGVFAPLPVGTFESGRLTSGVYDLIGNVSEWTETPHPGFFVTDRESLPLLAMSRRRLDAAPALGCWAPAPLVDVPAMLVAAADDDAARETVGADFASLMTDMRDWRAPSDFGDRLGLRLATSPRELVERIGADVLTIDGDERELWLRFCSRPGHAGAILAVLGAARVSVAARARWREALQ
jgi:Sulfatase-modifying factor enzyme 1